MEDKKLLKECRVVVTDLRSVLPPTMLAHLIVPSNQDDDEVEIVSEAVQSVSLSSPTKGRFSLSEFSHLANKTASSNFQLKNNPKDICSSGTNVKSFKNLNIYKRRRSLAKSLKRKGHHVHSNTLSTTNQAKNHLLQRYGSALLRKSSFEPGMLEKTDHFTTSLNGSQSGPELDKVSGENVNILDQKVVLLRNDHEAAQKIPLQEKLFHSNARTTENPSADLPMENIRIKREDGENVDVSKSEQLLSESSCPMPPVGLSVDVGVGHKLPTLQAKCVLTCLEKCGTSLSPQFAEFCSSVVKSSSESGLSKVLLPIEDERVLQFMRIKWQTRPDLQKIPLSIPTCSSESMSELVDENHSDVNEITSSVQSNETEKNDKEKVAEGSVSDVKSACKQIKKTVRRKRKNALTPRSDTEVPNNIDVSPADNSSNEDIQQKLPIKRHRINLIVSVKDKFLTNFQGRGNNCGKKRRLQYEEEQYSTDSDEETRNVDLKTLDNFPIPMYDPDDSRGVQSSESLTEECKQVTRGRKSHVMHELRRLNVAVFDLPNSQEPVKCRTTDICRLGCVCSSLVTNTVKGHCGLEKCMFGCVCFKGHSNHPEASDPSYAWMHNKAKANLAKEEKHFKQTVVRSDKDGLVLVEGRRKREIKIPNRYREDFVADLDLKPCHQLKSGRTSKGILQEAQVPDKASNIPRPTKKRAVSQENLTTVCDSEVFDLHSSSSDDAYEIFEDAAFSARTNVYDFKSKEDRQEKQEQLLRDTPVEKVRAAGDLKIISTQSVDVDEWEKTNKQIGNASNLELSCSALFKPSSNENKKKSIRLMTWSSLRKDIDQKNLFVWIKLASTRPKIFLTDSNVKPSESCIDIQSLNFLDPKYKDLPFHLKSLRSEYSLSGTEEQCVWIIKSIKSHWMIVGYMQQGQKKSEKSLSPDIDILSPPNENMHHRWWVMDIKQNFDLIYFMDFKKAITKDQILTLVKLSNEYSENETKVHRILLNRRRPKIDPRPTPYPDFGAYSLPSHPSKVFIGPYDFSKEPRFHVYAQKALLSEQIEFEKIPLFYSGGGEFVRVNAQGALSLHTEKPPEKYVEGLWYESSGSEFRPLDAQTLFPVTTTNDQDEVEGLPQADTETKNVSIGSEVSSKKSLETANGTANDSYGSDIEPYQLFSDISNDVSYGGPKGKHDESVTRGRAGEKNTQPKASPVQISVLKKDIGATVTSNTPRVSKDKCPPRTTLMESNQDNCVEIVDDDCENFLDLKIEYLVPCVRSLGYLPVTYLPTDALSVPHFTEPGLLQFFHTREDLIQEINRLIHFRLVCLQQKCSVVLKKGDICRCVAWKSVWEKEKCAHLPQFKPDVFNGYFMLTQYGLLDIRVTDKKAIRKLGEDWIDWLREDDFQSSVLAWHEKEKGENNDVLNLSLPGVLTLASKQIPKAYLNERAHKDKVKETVKNMLISSFTRKLTGIPGYVVPNFLELLDLDLLWESQQSICSLHQIMRHTPTAQNLSNIDTRHMSKSAFNIEENGMIDILNVKDGLACKLSPFSRLNICVEESGIKYSPLSSPPHPSSPGEHLAQFPTSPGKGPNILRRNKGGKNKSISSPGNLNTKQSRKQTFSVSLDNDEEPVFQRTPQDSPSLLGLKQNIETNFHKILKHPGSSSLPIDGGNGSVSSPITSFLQRRDSEPALKISSVGSGATFWHESNKSASLSCPDTQVGVEPQPVPSPGTTPTLPTSSVNSSRSPLPLPEEREKTSSDDQLSSIQISSLPLPEEREKTSSDDQLSSIQISSVASGAKAVSWLQRGVKRLAPLKTVRKVVKADTHLVRNTQSKVENNLTDSLASGESDSDGALKPQTSAQVKGSKKKVLSKKLGNSKNSPKSMKVLKKSSSSSSVTVTVPASALKVLRPETINKKFETNLKKLTEKTVETKDNDSDDGSIYNPASDESCSSSSS